MMPRLKRLKNKRLLCEFLDISIEASNELIANPTSSYRLQLVGKAKKREAEVPNAQLKSIHSRIKVLLDEFALPDYVHSGRKARSYLTNARIHSEGTDFAAMDIKSFYKNTKRNHVFRFFKNELEMSADVAWLITDLVTYKGFLPTGSPVSQLLAFWVHKRVFDKIDVLAREKNFSFSLYVDDLSFSSDQKIDRTLHLEVRQILSAHNLKLKRSKIRYKTQSRFEITGVVLENGAVKSPDRLKKRFFTELAHYEKNPDKIPSNHFSRVIGTLRSIRSIEPNKLPMLYNLFRKSEIRRSKRS